MRLKIFLFFLLVSINTFSQQYAIVTPEPLSGKIGENILKQGGNAFDAAVSIGFALAVSYPRAGNIGGGGFAMVYKKGSEPIALDFREKAPIKAFKTMYLDENGNVIKGKSTDTILGAGVPGTIKGLYELWEKYGSLPFETLIEPAVLLAKNGVVINQTEASYLLKYKKQLKKDKGCFKAFFKNGKPLQQGDKFIRKNLAKTLKLIGKCGADIFYKGKLGDKFVNEVKKNNGIISKKDLLKYKVVWRTPIIYKFNNDTLYLMPPPSSGGIVIAQILTMLQQFNLKNIKHNSVKYIHILAEIEKRCYADRNTYLGDPDYFPIKLNKLLDNNYLQKRAKSINLDIATKSKTVYPGYGKVETSGLMLQESTETTSFAVLDKNGNCVSITYTLNGNYGCKVLLPKTGILLNNEMDDFSSKPGTPNLFGLIGGIANQIEPEKRMLSSMTPAIVLADGKFKMALGSPGGSTIITTVLQTYLNVSLFNMNVTNAINSPRFHHQWLPDNIYLEPELFDNKLLTQRLEQKGQILKKRNKIGNAILILKKENSVFAAADKRGTGVAIISR